MKDDLYDEAIGRLRALLDEARAREPVEPNAMTLATCDQNGRPTARTVTLKDASPAGLVFYTDETSVKGAQMAQNAQACAVFFWRRLMEQVVVDGEVELVPDEEIEAYWKRRPRESQLVSWASDQSQPLEDRDTLLERVAEAKEKFRDQSVPRPPNWLGYRLVPTRLEFWKAGWQRPNERVSYELVDTSWSMRYLNP